ncbi:glucose 1-dehydrogenase [Sulfuracidifex metallicus]|uniref:Glucose 1-dehydrogenase n=1 Tax=Sulfuracidifex metallicus DSM 6482 = JCM 9184 TaxID=523847 RepID=A0A6A9QKU9_SULME|nr:glucose 1-dehydrogenase [Sulfuracidifex metallicus]MUN29887.1 glucose 1-dehydrogenase [Sulfuracidifex metallicus DSM 6482 = JCM 9184]WOE51727.1 glucose 1-dehydrogenase [Sulfuracidifex metallicus DSM 6482 = JCM 9184]
MSLQGKVVLVTGGSKGIGRAIAEEFHRQGAKVAINYNSSEEEAKKLKEKLGEGVDIFRADVSDRSQVSLMVKEIERNLGKVDILVNNAGIWYLFGIENYDESKFDRMWEINVKGVINTTLEVLPHMKEKREGVIINMASNASLGTSAFGNTFYSLTKASVVMLTRRMAFEFGKYKIRVNAIAPGWVETDMTIGGKSEVEIKELEKWFKERTMLSMVGKPEYIAKVAIFLAEAEYMTGQTVVVDGGRIDYLTHGI